MVTSASAMPTGHELTKMPMAVAMSRPANQSVTILVMNTVTNTPPAPATTRAATCIDHVGA